MSSESARSEDVMVSPKKRGLIHFNPKFSHQSSQDSNQSSTFPKPRKYFDSADFFMREEIKKDGSAGEKAQNSEQTVDKTHHGSALACECQTVKRTDSPDSGNSKNVVPLILLRRSKSSAMISSCDGTDEEPETLPTTVEVLNGPSNREVPSSQSSSNEGSPTALRDSALRPDSPVLDGTKPPSPGKSSPKSREEVRSLLIPRLTKTSAHEESTLATTSPLKTDDGEGPAED